MLNVFGANNTTKENVFWCVGHAGRHTTGAIDEVDALHECDVLPHLGLTRDRRNCADLLVPKGVDDGGFARVGVADETDRDLFAGGVKGGELTEKRDEGTLAEGVCDGGVEGKGRVFTGKKLDPASLCQSQ